MAFDEQRNQPSEPSSNFSEAYIKYEDQVKAISVEIKAAQQVLADTNTQVDAARIKLNASYTEKIDAFEKQIADLNSQITDLQMQHLTWLDKIKVRQNEYDSMVLNFGDKQKSLDASWADFHEESTEFLNQKEKLIADQKSLAASLSALSFNQEAWEKQKNQEQEDLAKSIKQAQDTLDEVNQKNAEADAKLSSANEAQLTVQKAQEDLTDAITQAKLLISQGQDVADQKQKNEVDAKNNSAQALVNQDDANQIKVAKVVLNNQQQEYQSRMATLQAAEAALKIGG